MPHLPEEVIHPVLWEDFPDPSVSSVRHEGFYYGYATQGRQEYNIQVARSKDLLTWELLPQGALAEKPVFARSSRDFWAPSPVVQEAGRFRFYYTVRPDNHAGLGISVATSDRPDGGYLDKRSSPLRQGPGFRVIDPHYLEDPRDGRKWLYWGSHEEPISVQELRDDGLEFAPGSEPQPVLSPPGDAPFRRLLEGFFVVYHPETDRFFGFASGSNTWEPHEYGISVYWAEDPQGPFRPPPGDNVILRPDERWLAPGQCSVVADGAGDSWLYHHAVDGQDTRNNWERRDIRRIMCRTKIVFSGGQPRPVPSPVIPR